jgi:hypothetical protein
MSGVDVLQAWLRNCREAGPSEGLWQFSRFYINACKAAGVQDTSCNTDSSIVNRVYMDSWDLNLEPQIRLPQSILEWIKAW